MATFQREKHAIYIIGYRARRASGDDNALAGAQEMELLGSSGRDPQILGSFNYLDLGRKQDSDYVADWPAVFASHDRQIY